MIKRCPKCNEPLYAQHIDKIDKVYCHHCGHEGKFSDGLPIRNADRIRNMAEEELAKFIESVQCYSHGWCEKCSSMNGDYCNGMKANEPDEGILEWIKQPVED